MCTSLVCKWHSSWNQMIASSESTADNVINIFLNPSLIQGHVAAAAGLAGCSKPPFHQQRSPALPAGPKDTPRPAEIYNPSSKSRAYLGAFAQMDMPGTPLRGSFPEVSRSNARTTLTGSFQFLSVAALLPTDVWVSHPTSMTKPSHSLEEPHFVHSYPQPSPFSHYPKLLTIIEGWNADRLVNQVFCLVAHFQFTPNPPSTYIIISS